MADFREFRLKHDNLGEKERGYVEGEVSALRWAVRTLGDMGHPWYDEAIELAEKHWRKNEAHLLENPRRAKDR
jgi:hypothetical protein